MTRGDAGTLSGGFERRFQHVGTPADHATTDQPPFIPDLPRMQAAAHGVDAELDVYEDADHMWRGSPDAASKALDRTIDVLRRRLGVHRITS